tara:strand:- start:3836 stop:4162 length:327 start_codon:yes stop_codon:yes gene_type:complete
MLTVFIEIGTDPVTPGQSGTTAAGKPYSIPDKQKAYAHVGLTYPVPFEVPVPQEGQYPAGNYLLGGDCIKLAKYGLEIDDRALKLVPVSDAIAELQRLAAPASDAGKK